MKATLERAGCIVSEHMQVYLLWWYAHLQRTQNPKANHKSRKPFADLFLFTDLTQSPPLTQRGSLRLSFCDLNLVSNSAHKCIVIHQNLVVMISVSFKKWNKNGRNALEMAGSLAAWLRGGWITSRTNSFWFSHRRRTLLFQIKDKCVKYSCYIKK